MSGRARIIVAVVGAIVVCLLFFLFFIRPRQSELTRVEEDIVAAQDENQTLQGQLQSLQALQERAPQLNALIDEIRGFVPERHETANLIFQIQEAANTSGVGFLQITPELPKTPPETATLAEVRVTIRARGGYFSLQDFIRRLYDLDRALRIDNLTLTAIAEGAEDAGVESEIELVASARVFFELPAGGAGAAPAAPAPGTPVPSPTDTGAPQTPQG
ncbi:MAG: type 4a pilus biogenesis protein PilO [Actinomycetota bacterium]|nr:type 4a pilus biogenesis protein PilO [Actinomycetota bacterium]